MTNYVCNRSIHYMPCEYIFNVNIKSSEEFGYKNAIFCLLEPINYLDSERHTYIGCVVFVISKINISEVLYDTVLSVESATGVNEKIFVKVCKF